MWLTAHTSTAKKEKTPVKILFSVLCSSHNTNRDKRWSRINVLAITSFRRCHSVFLKGIWQESICHPHIELEVQIGGLDWASGTSAEFPRPRELSFWFLLISSACLLVFVALHKFTCTGSLAFDVCVCTTLVTQYPSLCQCSKVSVRDFSVKTSLSVNK